MGNRPLTYSRQDEEKDITSQKQLLTPPQNANKTPQLYHTFGNYAPMLLNPDRLDPDIAVPYVTVRYNPLTDTGKGNWIAVQSVSKATATIKESVRYLFKEQPLWMMLYGFYDYVSKSEGPKVNWEDIYRLIVRCEATKPPLTTSDYSVGFVVYGNTFATGNMPGGDPFVPVYYQERWYPTLRHQQEVAEAIVESGPLMPRNPAASSFQVTAGYNFRFLLGGQPPPGQLPQDPCKVEKYDQFPDPGNQLAAVQVTDPRLVDPTVGLHAWDWRRGFLTEKSLKRMSDYQPHDLSLYSGSPPSPKRPKTDVQMLGDAPERDGYAALRALLQEQEAESPAGPGGLSEICFVRSLVTMVVF